MSENFTPNADYGLGDTQCEFCGHIFDLRDDRLDHEQATGRVLCPCGDVCRDDEG